MEIKSIIYVSTARFPTEKAYGITIKYTMRALQLFGYNCRVVDFRALATRRLATLFDYRSVQILKEFSFQLGFGRLVFNLKRLTVAMAARHLFMDGGKILWTRDPLIAFIVNLTRKPANTVIEVHQVPHLLDKLLMRRLSMKPSVILAPISIDLQNRLSQSRFNFTASSIILCPMGVPEEFFKPKTRRTRLNAKKITLTYVGGLTSNGVDQGIKHIIFCIQSHNRKLIEPLIDFHLFGLSATEELELRKSFPDEFKNQSIVCEKRQPHRTLVPKLQEADVFLLPYPEGDFFNVRFPLKALEYAALARPIMVSDTPSHRNIFNQREVWFFNQQSCEDFQITLKKLIDNEEATSKKVKLAYAKAENFTYRRRVEKIVEKFHN